ncbi:MAG: triose-phosphate isomerase [Phyllobacteriaceae bacterium]|nr:triose-phosphate isomerase [Phyllobacteriaceae bacterium]
MTPGIKPLVAGNWKMNGTSASLGEIGAMNTGFDAGLQQKIDMLVCVPATLLFQASEVARNGRLQTGAQDCHARSSGAHTGDISVAMIADAGGSAVIVGHSERRADHGETSEAVREKAVAGLGEGLQTIVCIGETEEERKGGKTLDVLKEQLALSLPDQWQGGELVVAYEPVWAIGTGLTPTADDVAEAHAFMRAELVGRYGEIGNAIRLLYGGSVKPGNAKELMAVANVDGALVGGASLKAADLLGIAAAYLEI